MEEIVKRKKSLVFGGWSISNKIFDGIFKKDTIYIDINKLVSTLVEKEELKLNWKEIFIEKILLELIDDSYDIYGWSTGAYFAFILADYLKTDNLHLISASPSFCCRNDYIYGLKPIVLKSMRRQLRTNKEKVLKDFQEQSGISYNSEFSSKYSEKELFDGLVFLENISLLDSLVKSNSNIKNINFHHAKDDNIVSSLGGKFFAKSTNSSFFEYSGGHTFFIKEKEKFKNNLGLL